VLRNIGRAEIDVLHFRRDIGVDSVTYGGPPGHAVVIHVDPVRLEVLDSHRRKTDCDVDADALARVFLRVPDAGAEIEAGFRRECGAVKMHVRVASATSVRVVMFLCSV
jgi:hypothetical protein